jgi:DNA-binding FrmR family transcriptional regulator
MFEMAAPIQNPAKCEVRSIIRFLNAKGERPAEIHKQIVAVCGNVMISRLFLHLKKHVAGEKFDDDDDEVQEKVMTWFKVLAADFYDSGIQKLVPRLNKCLDNAGDCVEK